MRIKKKGSFYYDVQMVSMALSLDEQEIRRDQEYQPYTHTFRKNMDYPAEVHFGDKSVNHKELNFHRHEFCQIMWVMEGACRYLINNEWVSMKTGDIIFINSDIAHSWLAEPSSKVLYLIFSAEDLKPDEYCLGYHNRFRLFFSVAYPYVVIRQNEPNNADYRRIIEQIALEARNEFAFCESVIHGLILQFTMYLLRETFHLDEETGQEPYSENITKALKYIREHLTEDISIRDVAKHLYLNETYFSHSFNKMVGVSFSRYIIIQRLSYASGMIEDSSKNMAEIAEDSGFGSLSSFYRYFKEYYGKSPVAYRKMLSREIMPENVFQREYATESTGKKEQI